MDGCGAVSIELNQLVENLGYGVLCCRNDSALTIEYACDAFYQKLGYIKEEIPALSGSRRNPVLRNPEPVNWAKVRGDILKNGYATQELRLIKKDGHHMWAAWRVSLTEQNGKEFFCGLIHDVTQERHCAHMQKVQAEEIETLTANVPGGVLRCREDDFFTLVFISDGFCRMTGYSRTEIQEIFHNRFIDMVYPNDRKLLSEQTSSESKEGIAAVTIRIVGRNGRVVWVMDKVRRTVSPEGEKWLYCVLIDISETKKAQDELAFSEERYRLILEHAADPVFDYDLKTKRFYFSPAFTAKFGTGFLCEGNLSELLASEKLFHPQDRERLTDTLHRILSGERLGDGEYRMKTSDEKFIWCNIHPTVFFDRQGAATRLIAVISDIDKRKKETLVLRQKAEHDLLTGLYNKITTENRINQILSEEKKGERHALFVIDIDNFKMVNDRLGHLSGDQLIVETASQIQKQFREDDIVGRIGGDEFVVFLKNITSDLIMKKAEILHNIFSRIKNQSARTMNLSGSVGVSFYPQDGKNYEELFQKADAAMYAAKNGGKDSFCVYCCGIENLAHQLQKSL